MIRQKIRAVFLPLALAVAVTFIAVVALLKPPAVQGLGSRLKSDCRERLIQAVGTEVRLEWRPGPTNVVRQPNGRYRLKEEARALGRNSLLIGIAAHCTYNVAADSSFTRYSTRIERAQLQPPDSAEQNSR